MEELRNTVKSTFMEFAGRSIQFEQLDTFLDLVGFSKPSGFKIKEFAAKYDVDKSGTLELEEFMELFNSLEISEVQGAKLKEQLTKGKSLFSLESSSKAAEGTKHSATEDEVIGMVSYVNLILNEDENVKHLLPIESDAVDLFKKVNDGILLCKLLNAGYPGTISTKAINMKPKLDIHKLQNHVLLLNSASSVGLFTQSTDGHALLNGVQHLVLGLVWQMVKKYLLAKINLHDNPYLSCLLREGETMEQFLALSPEEILIRWVNYQLKKCPDPFEIGNFTSDVKDSKMYAHLLKVVAPNQQVVHDPHDILSKSDHVSRGEMVIKNALALDLPKCITARNIAAGTGRLNLAFVASIFNKYPNLEPVEIVYPIVVETREEKTFRNWMNSLGVEPYVSHLYEDLKDGRVLLLLMNKIKAGHVPDNIIKGAYAKNNNEMRIIEYCNHVVSYAKALGVNTTTCDGMNIRNASKQKEMFLGVIWQLMRVYTVSLLVKLSGSGSKIEDRSILDWANSMVDSSLKINSFSDSKIKDSFPVANLIEAISPGSINLSLLTHTNDPDKLLENASYTISIARKIGARIYALPEDIVDASPKMVMTIYACLMSKYMEDKSKGSH